MTAFAQARNDTECGEISCELRTVNHRYLEINPRLPEEIRQFEPKIRDLLAKRIKRGRVDCTMRLQPQSAYSQELGVNDALVAALISLASDVRQQGGDVEPIRVIDILRWPGVIKPTQIDSEQLQAAVIDVVSNALQDVIDTRTREGMRLADLVLDRVSAARTLVTRVKDVLPDINQTFRQRLQERLAEVREQLDPNRVEQEIVLFLQKIDVAEELDRLEIHLDEIQSVLSAEQPIGRRLDFLMQELHREANTLGAKSVDTATTQASVELKVLIEQMREQVQNIE
jgi:uncharacterized protein (TIGR00255 family)